MYAQEQNEEVISDSLFIKHVDSVNLKNDAKIEAYIDSVQTVIEKEKYWIRKNILSLDISEVAFVNWNAGGTSSISGLLGINLQRDYKKENILWENKFNAKYGVNKQEEIDLRKTDDILEFISTFGHRKDTLTNWYNSVNCSFKTQFSNGYNHINPETKTLISRFMSPGYFFLGVGSVYGKEADKFTLYLSPLTFKETFVLDQDLADLGAFGVVKAEYDEEGNRIKQGENFRTELGILIKVKDERELMQNVFLKNYLSLYTDYINNFGNVDIDWELIVDFSVNDYIKATLGSHVIYDDDIKIFEPQADGTSKELGARTQWKQLLGIGVIFDI